MTAPKPPAPDPQKGKRGRSSSRRKWGCWVVLLAVAAFCAMNFRWFTTNDITTGHSREYPELSSHVYAADVMTTRQAATEACAYLRRWRVLPPAMFHEVTPEVRAEVGTALFHFVDDVTMRFETLPSSDQDASPHTRVVIRSHSRVGRGDLGENARHIRALQAAMDARLPLVPPKR